MDKENSPLLAVARKKSAGKGGYKYSAPDSKSAVARGISRRSSFGSENEEPNTPAKETREKIGSAARVLAGNSTTPSTPLSAVRPRSYLRKPSTTRRPAISTTTPGNGDSLVATGRRNNISTLRWTPQPIATPSSRTPQSGESGTNLTAGRRKSISTIRRAPNSVSAPICITPHSGDSERERRKSTSAMRQTPEVIATPGRTPPQSAGSFHEAPRRQSTSRSSQPTEAQKKKYLDKYRSLARWKVEKEKKRIEAIAPELRKTELDARAVSVLESDARGPRTLAHFYAPAIKEIEIEKKQAELALAMQDVVSSVINEAFRQGEASVQAAKYKEIAKAAAKAALEASIQAATSKQVAHAAAEAALQAGLDTAKMRINAVAQAKVGLVLRDALDTVEEEANQQSKASLKSAKFQSFTSATTPTAEFSVANMSKRVDATASQAFAPTQATAVPRHIEPKTVPRTDKRNIVLLVALAFAALLGLTILQISLAKHKIKAPTQIQEASVIDEAHKRGGENVNRPIDLAQAQVVSLLGSAHPIETELYPMEIFEKVKVNPVFDVTNTRVEEESVDQIVDQAHAADSLGSPKPGQSEFYEIETLEQVQFVSVVDEADTHSKESVDIPVNEAQSVDKIVDQARAAESLGSPQPAQSEFYEMDILEQVRVVSVANEADTHGRESVEIPVQDAQIANLLDSTHPNELQSYEVEIIDQLEEVSIFDETDMRDAESADTPTERIQIADPLDSTNLNEIQSYEMEIVDQIEVDIVLDKANVRDTESVDKPIEQTPVVDQAIIGTLLDQADERGTQSVDTTVEQAQVASLLDPVYSSESQSYAMDTVVQVEMASVLDGTKAHKKESVDKLLEISRPWDAILSPASCRPRLNSGSSLIILHRGMLCLGFFVSLCIIVRPGSLHPTDIMKALATKGASVGIQLKAAGMRQFVFALESVESLLEKALSGTQDDKLQENQSEEGLAWQEENNYTDDSVEWEVEEQEEEEEAHFFHDQGDDEVDTDDDSGETLLEEENEQEYIDQQELIENEEKERSPLVEFIVRNRITPRRSVRQAAIRRNVRTTNGGTERSLSPTRRDESATRTRRTSNNRDRSLSPVHPARGSKSRESGMYKAVEFVPVRGTPYVNMRHVRRSLRNAPESAITPGTPMQIPAANLHRSSSFRSANSMSS